MHRKLLTRTSLAVFLVLAAGTAWAQGDPPGRVGRISHIDGTVSFHAAGQSQWVPAPLNYPVVAGESFWTEPRARLELEVGAAEIRLDERTALDIVALDDRSTRLSLSEGVINLHLAAMPRGGVVVMTPRGPVTLLAPGSYDIDAGDGNGPAGAPPDRLRVTVLQGRAAVSGPRSRVDVLEGETAAVAGEPASVTLSEGSATPFDDWALQRDQQQQAEASLTYLSPETTGYEDLDQYGRWTRDPDYGAVWYPTAVATGWAPYRYGHWAWVPPWGWTWIDDAPWGFAPFHYGRWVEVGGRWGWCPGERVLRPVYAPALVAFIGGAGFGVAIAAGPAMPAVGWVPLAPHEIYRPAYVASVTYIREVNITTVNRVEINRITKATIAQPEAVTHFHNARAATVVSASAFVRAAPVQRAVVAVPHEALARQKASPRLAHLEPGAAARAGIAMPEAARPVPHPNAPPRLERPPATAGRPTAAAAALPKAPGPSRRSAEHREPQEASHAHPPAAAARPQERAQAAQPHRPPPGQHAAQRTAAKPVHPPQQMRLVATPHGWVRAPQPHAAPPQHRPSATPQRHPASRDNNEPKKEEPKKEQPRGG